MTDGWRERALSRVRPTPEEDEAVQAAAGNLVDALAQRLEAEGWQGTPRVEGSIAKGTYLAGEADLDVFVAFPPDVDRSDLAARARELADLLDDPAVAYAEHPYAQGTYEGHDAEIVPCYDVDDARELQSAVDRTPYHTAYVKDALDEDARDEVRLLKAFLEAAGCYGAKEATRGISGYLAELVVLARGGFEDALAWAVDGFEHPIVVEGEPEDTFEDPLVVVDPVDPTRNAAAAVAVPTLERFREAAARFRERPRASFFAVPPAPAMDAQTARERCRARRTRALAVAVPADAADVEDPVHAQLRRAVTLAAEELSRELVPVHATATLLEGEDAPDRGWILLEARAPALDEPVRHAGPPAHLEDHAERFRERWRDAPDAAGPVVEEDGRLFVDVHRDADTLADLAVPHLEEANAGKVVDAALDDGTARVLEGDEALVEMPPAARAALLDRRRPWERAEADADAGWHRARPAPDDGDAPTGPGGPGRSRR